MAVNAEILPVAPIGGVMMVIAILVMNGQQLPIGLVKLPSASRADQAMDGQRPFPVILSYRPLSILLQFPDDLFRRSGGFSLAAGTLHPNTPPFTAEGHLRHLNGSLRFPMGLIIEFFPTRCRFPSRRMGVQEKEAEMGGAGIPAAFDSPVFCSSGDALPVPERSTKGKTPWKFKLKSPSGYLGLFALLISPRGVHPWLLLPVPSVRQKACVPFSKGRTF